MIDYKYYFNDENKDTILLIHGWNTTSLYMEGFIKAFSTSYNIINVDLFNKLNKPYKIENFFRSVLWKILIVMQKILTKTPKVI